MQKRPKGVSPIDWTYNRLGRPINPDFEADMDALMKKLHAKRVKRPKGEVMVVTSLDVICLEDLERW